MWAGVSRIGQGRLVCKAFAHIAKGSMTKRGTRKPPRTDKPTGPRQAPDPAFPMHEHIGHQLKAMFDEVVTQPVPDKLRKLLEDLERKQSKT